MRKKYIVTGPHTGTTYPEWEVEEVGQNGRTYTVAYLHSQNHANVLAIALTKGKHENPS